MGVNLQEVGNRIKNIRVSRGDSMESFGKRLNTSKAAVNNWEKGVNLPNNKRIRDIAIIGGITVSELLYGPFIEYAQKFVERLTYDEDFVFMYDLSKENRKEMVDKTMYQVLKKGIAKHFYDSGEIDAARSNIAREFSDTGLRKITDTDFTNVGALNYMSRDISGMMEHLEEYRDNGVDSDVYKDIENIIEIANDSLNALYEKYKDRLK